jgi:superfamily II RNA helicase
MESINAEHQKKTKGGKKRLSDGRPKESKRAAGRIKVKRTQSVHSTHLKPAIEPVLKGIFNRIGKPQESGFIPDKFQLQALEAVERTDCLVMAPTGSGKRGLPNRQFFPYSTKGAGVGMPLH